MIGVCSCAVLLVAGIQARHVVVLALLAVTAVGAVIVSGTLDTYKIDRFASFLDQSTDEPASEQTQAEYNLEQAKSAIVTGGFGGSGLFNGKLTKNAYVPEQHTDFIFTVVGEEFGFVGGAAVILLYGVLIWRLWRIALMSSDFFGTLVAVGILAMFAFQVFENIGMTLGMMPITGLPAPVHVVRGIGRDRELHGGRPRPQRPHAPFQLNGSLAAVRLRRYLRCVRTVS